MLSPRAKKVQDWSGWNSASTKTALSLTPSDRCLLPKARVAAKAPQSNLLNQVALAVNRRSSISGSRPSGLFSQPWESCSDQLGAGFQDSLSEVESKRAA